jgi:hypothetical protein
MPPELKVPPKPESPPERPKRSLFADFHKSPWFWLLCINGGIPLALLAIELHAEELFATVAFVCCVALFFAGSRRFKKDRSHLAILAIPAGLASCGAPMAWSRCEELRNAPRAEDISVRDATQHSTAYGFRFRDATVRRDLMSQVTVEERDSKNRRIQRSFRVYPIVPEGWTPKEPVTVWSTVSPPLKSPMEGIREPHSSDHVDAAIDASRKRGLITHPQALYLNMSLTVEQEVARLEKEALILWAVPNLLWLAAALFTWGRQLLNFLNPRSA